MSAAAAARLEDAGPCAVCAGIDVARFPRNAHPHAPAPFCGACGRQIPLVRVRSEGTRGLQVPDQHANPKEG